MRVRGLATAASAYIYTGTLWANSQAGGCGECVRVHRHTMSKQSGPAHTHQGRCSQWVRVHNYTMRKQSE